MGKYVRKPEVIEAEQFFVKSTPWPRGVGPQDCGCAGLAQDGRRCELHKEKGRRYGLVRVDGRDREICNTNWIITNNSGPYPMYKIMSDEAFKAQFEPVSGDALLKIHSR